MNRFIAFIFVLALIVTAASARSEHPRGST